eukprot:COSAG05_NODE_4505_length_1486_cov_1.337419_1_plen_90_part_00
MDTLLVWSRRLRGPGVRRHAGQGGDAVSRSSLHRLACDLALGVPVRLSWGVFLCVFVCEFRSVFDLPYFWHARTASNPHSHTDTCIRLI